jgi:hypothetical protein
METYGGELPVSEDWVEEHHGEEWQFEIALRLGEIIEAEGIDDMNEIVDDVTGVMLMGATYEFGGTGLPPEDIIIRVSGTVPA